MIKSFKYFKAPSNNGEIPATGTVHKYSIYMQSRDTKWLNRNIKRNQIDEYYEPIEEDIGD